MASDNTIELASLPELVIRDPESWSGIACLVIKPPEAMTKEAFRSLVAQALKDNPAMAAVKSTNGTFVGLARNYKQNPALNAAPSCTIINDIRTDWQQLCRLLNAEASLPVIATTPPRDKNLSLLIVEDDKMSSKMIAANLQQFGKVTVTGNYRQAIANSMIERPDLIFLDIHYRDDNNDGFDVMRNLASFDANQFVVMFSGDNDPLTIYRCLAAGARGFIAKPFTAASFAHYVEKFHSACSAA